MAEPRTAKTSKYDFLWKLYERPKDAGASLSNTQKWSRGWHNIENLAQDQVVIRIGRGSKIDTYRGLHLRTDEDSQSDLAYAPSVQINNDTLNAAWKAAAVLHDLAWELPKSVTDEESSQSVPVLEPVEEQDTDTAIDDVSQLSPDKLASAIMQPDAENDMPRLREMILAAEDISFSVEQSKQLSEWLLSFAQRHCGSEDPKDEPPVLSAIRTGASMLRQDQVNCLIPLLGPGHSIETSLVTLKMIGRIFEVQPPVIVDEHQDIANEVCHIAKSLLNPHVITASQSAAKAQLSIYALVAMVSSETDSIIKSVKELGVTWFTRRTIRKLRKLNQRWASCSPTIEEAPRELLETALQVLESD